MNINILKIEKYTLEDEEQFELWLLLARKKINRKLTKQETLKSLIKLLINDRSISNKLLDILRTIKVQ
jgi:hypothetical protein